ncbi:MAG: DNA-formamidopyrimidine glycosylase, partial [Acidobacteria bacterium]|nr:DNA-formamidopyrimidine glycosylase [Acidobacteriota bacterium]
MPELPEVEVLRRSLERPLVGDRFEAVRVHFPTLREPLCERRLRRLEGHRVVGLRRRAKYLLIDASGGQTLVLHLGMSGRLTLVDRAAPLVDHE